MLHYFDRTSMAHSLEVRVPFLDHEVVEFCATIPTNLKVRGTTTKYLLKRAARGIVPDRIIDRPKVGFFNAAAESWFRAQTDGVIAKYLLDPAPAFAEWVDVAYVQRLVRAQASGVSAFRRLLPLLMLEIWLSEYLPRAVGPVGTERERILVAR
jgi:asparagine synthase (glutamine-hydrolysing)